MNNVLASYFNPQQTIILVAVSIVGVILIILNIVLAIIFHRRGERKLFSKLLQQQRELYLKQLADMRSNPEFSEDTTPYKPFFNMGSAPVESAPQEQPLEEPEDLVIVDEEQDIVDEVIIDGKVVRYNKSFTARLIQATDELKSRYSELKNYILAYKGVKNKISWKKEAFRLGRNTLAVFVIRGKTLCLCLALDPKQFENTKYKVNDLSIRSPKSKTPCLYRITNDRRVKYAKDLIDMLLIEDYQAERLERALEDYTLPYETTEALIARDLIRIVGTPVEKVSIEEQKEDSIPENEPEEIAEEPAESETEEEFDEEKEVIEETIVNGIVVRYNKSFIARLSQGTEELNSRYSDLKNYILSFKGVKSRISWKKEAFRQGRNPLATFVVRGKSLCLCLALDPKQFEDTKYKVKDLSIRSPKSKTPCLYRITNDRRVKYAKELINLLFEEKYHLTFIEKEIENFAIPYASTEELIERDLIRVVGNDVEVVDVPVEETMTEPSEQAETVEASSIENNAETAETIEKEAETVDEVVLYEPTPMEEVEDEVLESETALPEVFLEDEEAEIVEEIKVNGQTVRYNRSFLAAVAQTTDTIKKRYSDIKNYLLSYKNIKCRTNWKRETFSLGKESLACFVIRNQTLCLCLALDPKRFENTKFKVIDLSLYSSRSKMPCMYRISNVHRVEYAKELIDILLQELNVSTINNKPENYVMPYETTEKLIARGLIRVSVDTKEK